MIDLARDATEFLARLRDLHEAVQDAVVASREIGGDLAKPIGHAAGDVIFRLDAHVEPIVIEHARRWARDFPLVLIAEGLGADGITILPEGAAEADAVIRVIVDPIDGTRGLMYDKRSAWCLTGIAPNRGPQTSLSDIEIARMTELPTSKQDRCDALWSIRDRGSLAERRTVRGTIDERGRDPAGVSLDGTAQRVTLTPSEATTLDHGFAAVSSFFPGTKRLAADLMETIARKLSGGDAAADALIFDDQYISTGGQLYELITGHDRFLCDLRALFYRLMGDAPGHCCHAYDLCTKLIADEAGVILTDGEGGKLDAPLDVHADVNWAGFANATLRSVIEPILLDWIAARKQERPS